MTRCPSTILQQLMILVVVWTKTIKKAAQWYLEAAKQGHIEAQTNLSILYAEGLGVAQDYVEAAKWLLEAAQQGDGFAQHNLGIQYANGEGVRHDYVYAYVLKMLAVRQGIEPAIKNLETLKQSMTAEQLDDAERQANAWEPGSSMLKFEIGLLALMKADYEKAAQTFLPLAENGDTDAQVNLVSAYMVLHDQVNALKWQHILADKGEVAGQYGLGLSYLNGEGVPQNDKEAADWFRKAADQGYAPAQYDLGLLYYNGRGVEQDFVRAYLWLVLAAAGYQNQIDAGCDLVKYKKDAERARKKAAGKLNRGERERAQQLVEEWYTRHRI